MPCYGAECPVTQVLWYRRVIEDRRLHDASREHNFITSWVIVGLNDHRLSLHSFSVCARGHTLTVGTDITQLSLSVGFPALAHIRVTWP